MLVLVGSSRSRCAAEERFVLCCLSLPAAAAGRKARPLPGTVAVCREDFRRQRRPRIASACLLRQRLSLLGEGPQGRIVTYVLRGSNRNKLQGIRGIVGTPGS